MIVKLFCTPAPDVSPTLAIYKNSTKILKSHYCSLHELQNTMGLFLAFKDVNSDKVPFDPEKLLIAFNSAEVVNIKFDKIYLLENR